jgi:hypothetical protein
VTWLVWRRQRSALLVAATLVAVTIVALVVARLMVTTEAASLGASACLTDTRPDCAGAGAVTRLRDSFLSSYRLLQFGVWVEAPLLGLIVSATLFARETTEQTVVFALTQSTTRGRWWATGVFSTLLVALVAVLLVTLVGLWGLAPFSTLYRQSPMEPLVFDAQGLWPSASALLAFAIAVLAGTLLRSSMGVIVVTVIGWVVVTAALLFIRYDHLLPVATQQISVGSYVTEGTAEVKGMPRAPAFLDATGREIPLRSVGADCDPREDYGECLERTGVAAVGLRYQPDSNFWPLQGIQAGIAVVLSAALLTISRARAGWRG